ncbi:hypothetical protein RHMOL_Rhmol02G0258900 [Rhododendron molle]|uniref:Uncharacterized protein n=1 Tax=Rhododendron molle TaxID=49168 RepID=A0ACC0PXB4_RHOML|nr:hypothetical protein RHMOL_Rhmol02G0258900 [Rhododendron molle]
MISDQIDFLYTCSPQRVLQRERFRSLERDRSGPPRSGQHVKGGHQVPSPYQCYEFRSILADTY